MINYLKTNKYLFICIFIILISSFIASAIQSSFGKVSVEVQKLQTDDGQTLVYDLYKPRVANSSNKVPFVVVFQAFKDQKKLYQI